jgi:hypothetical protein
VRRLHLFAGVHVPGVCPSWTEWNEQDLLSLQARHHDILQQVAD